MLAVVGVDLTAIQHDKCYLMYTVLRELPGAVTGKEDGVKGRPRCAGAESSGSQDRTFSVTCSLGSLARAEHSCVLESPPSNCGLLRV